MCLRPPLPRRGQCRQCVRTESTGKEAAAAHKNAPVPVDRIAAVVNHDVITEIQLQQRIHQVATNLRRRNIPLPPMDNLRDQTLDRMILERIIEQKARDTGIRIDDNMLNGDQ